MIKIKSTCLIVIQWHPDTIVSHEDLVSSFRYFGDFLPEPLSELVDLKLYAEKLRSFADIAYAKIDNETVGILAMYANNLDTRTAFVSMLSVAPRFQACGVGKSLVLQAIKRARIRGMNSVTLKVLSNNTRALGLYKSLGFELLESFADRMLLKFNLNTSGKLEKS